MSIAIGIDLGHHNCVIAWMLGNSPRVLDNEFSNTLTPAIIHISETGEAIVGELARGMSPRGPEHTISSFLRLIGRQFNDSGIQASLGQLPYKLVEAPNGEIEVILRNQRYTPTKLCTLLLSELKRNAEAALGTNVSHAAIAVPAYLTQHQRDAVREAAQLAGLEVLRITNRTVAATIAYGYQAKMDQAQTVLVYDLGGSTFETTVAYFDAIAGYHILATVHDLYLGGDSFNHRVVDWIVNQINHTHAIDVRMLPNARSILLEINRKAEEAKRRLERAQWAPIIIPGLIRIGGRIIDIECELSRDSFNMMVQDIVDHSIQLSLNAIQNAEIKPDEINAVLLVGGATRTPIVQETLRNRFGSRVAKGDIDPTHCIAQGMALMTLFPPELQKTSEQAHTGELPTTSSSAPRALRVFLCHSSGDKPLVRDLYRRLIADSIDAWLDEEKLIPGQDWNLEIQKAVRASDIVIVCLSESSINKAGYVQKEIQYALDVADEQPEGKIFLIPLKLEECKVPQRLRRWQWVDYFQENGYRNLTRALSIRANMPEPKF